MPRPALELADIFRQHGAAYRHNHALPLPQRRVMRAIETCRTAALGGHVDRCSRCHYTRISYNSCRGALWAGHCPKCQNTDRARCLEWRQSELLPVEYFHVVFTLPEPIAAIAFYNKAVVYRILFAAAAETLTTLGRDPTHLGAELGFFAVLHTWGQNLLHHPHLHCVVPGGGLSPDRQSWVSCRPGFFLPVRVVSRLFRRLFLQALTAAFEQGKLEFFGDLEQLQDPAAFAAYLEPCRRSEWVVYAKPPFGGPRQVLAYLSRYTHRVAISNQRLVSLEAGQVTFDWKDYRHPQKTKRMTVAADEFIRRFLLHVLPPGFPRIRHFGFLANCHRQEKLALCRKLLSTAAAELLPGPKECVAALAAMVPPTLLNRCPQCGGEMIRIEILGPYRWPALPPDTS